MASPSKIEDTPFLPPPSGQVSNFENPESRDPAIITVCSIFLALIWPMFLLRIYSKAWVTRTFGWDDGKGSQPQVRKLANVRWQYPPSLRR